MEKKKIHFNKMNSKLNGVILIPAVICICIGLFELFTKDEGNYRSPFLIAGNALMALYFLRMLIYRNYVGYNKVGATIRINSVLGKQVNYKDVLSIRLEDDVLYIEKKNGIKYTFDLSEFNQEDIHRLVQLLPQKDSSRT